MIKSIMLAVIWLVCIVGDATAETNAAHVVGTNSLSFRPKNGTWYGLSPHTTYRGDDSANPGPASRNTNIAWSLANEFVNRTALRNWYVLPATSSGAFSLMDTDADPALYIVSFKEKSPGRQLVLLVNIETRQIGIVHR